MMCFLELFKKIVFMNENESHNTGVKCIC